MKTRTFVAVPLAPDIRRRALDVIRRLQPVAGDVKWVEPENMHWTLQFLGDVMDLELPAICDAVSSAVADIEPFDLIVRGAGAFPSADRPRTLWLGAGHGANEMTTLQSAIELALEELGFRGEQRRYTPHVTLGRAGRDRAPSRSDGRPHVLAAELAALADFPAGTMLIDEVSIVASTLTRSGPDYRILAHALMA
jgi:RNA 2',3'-cyclic 3'-phosphodiesterase